MEVPLVPTWYKTSAHIQTELHVCSQALFSLKQNCSSTHPQDSSLISRCSQHNIAIRQNTVTSCRNWWSVNHCLVSPITLHTCIALAAIQNLQESTKKKELEPLETFKAPRGLRKSPKPSSKPSSQKLREHLLAIAGTINVTSSPLTAGYGSIVIFFTSTSYFADLSATHKALIRYCCRS